jgi:hypothetical protein
MAKKDLENIIEQIKHADDHLRSAEEITRKVKDNRGGDSIKEVREGLKRVKKENFPDPKENNL